MSKYAVTTGVQTAPVKTVLYGPEGIGKSTFASHFPDPVFIDTEGGTKRLNVARLPQPTSWAMLLDEVAEVRKGSVPCGTLVLDTADWAERLCIQAVCARAKVNGIEDFGYGKGYTYVKEEFAKLLDALEEVLNAGHNVVVLAHAAITKFEQPDAVGNYDRWSMKTSKQVAPLLREWCDMLLFANYKTVVEKAGSSPNAKNKASGGRRVRASSRAGRQRCERGPFAEQPAGFPIRPPGIAGLPPRQPPAPETAPAPHHGAVPVHQGEAAAAFPPTRRRCAPAGSASPACWPRGGRRCAAQALRRRPWGHSGKGIVPSLCVTSILRGDHLSDKGHEVPARCQRDRVGTHVKNRDSIQVHLGKESFHFLFIVAKTVHAGDHQQVEAAVAHIVQNRLDAGSVIHASGAELQRLKHFPPNSPSIACGCRQAPFLLFPQDGFFLDFVAGIKTFHYNHGFSSFLSRTAATKKAR